ncbi:hypothetical protein PG985_013756 [Apiospora marii]|uniref:Uncharacterized protein n=1 Tax=Apiospora marii TaxID=335849 RepID=A0ABR1R7V1_9PEZI
MNTEISPRYSWYLKHKHVVYDRDVEGDITDTTGLHPEVVMRRDRKVTGSSVVASRSARDLEAQFVNDMVPSMTKKSLRKLMLTATAREIRPRARHR